MKRTESRLKSKGIKSHVPNDYHAHDFYKFNRYFVAANYGEVNRVSNICGSRRAARMHWDENPNVRLWTYLNRYMHKQIGRKMDDVFHDFSQLGWKTSIEMFHYWSGFTESWSQEYYADKEGHMRLFPYSYRGDVRYCYLLNEEDECDDWDDFDEEEEDDDNEKYLVKYARKPSSEKRLVRQKLCRKCVTKY